jgi:hypothetical protein
MPPERTRAQLRAENATATRYGDTERAERALSEYYTLTLEEIITKTVAKAPPLKPEQIERLRTLLTPSAHSEAA